MPLIAFKSLTSWHCNTSSEVSYSLPHLNMLPVVCFPLNWSHWRSSLRPVKLFASQKWVLYIIRNTKCKHIGGLRPWNRWMEYLHVTALWDDSDLAFLTTVHTLHIAVVPQQFFCCTWALCQVARSIFCHIDFVSVLIVDSFSNVVMPWFTSVVILAVILLEMKPECQIQLQGLLRLSFCTVWCNCIIYSLQLSSA